MNQCPGCGSRSAHIMYQQIERFIRCETFGGKQLPKGGFYSIYSTPRNGRCNECGHNCRRASQYDERVPTPKPARMVWPFFSRGQES